MTPMRGMIVSMTLQFAHLYGNVFYFDQGQCHSERHIIYYVAEVCKIVLACDLKTRYLRIIVFQCQSANIQVLNRLLRD